MNSTFKLVLLFTLYFPNVTIADGSEFEGRYEFLNGYRLVDSCSNRTDLKHYQYPNSNWVKLIVHDQTDWLMRAKCLSEVNCHDVGWYIGENYQDDKWLMSSRGISCRNTNPEDPPAGDGHLIRTDNVVSRTGDGYIETRRTMVFLVDECPETSEEARMLAGLNSERFQCESERVWNWQYIGE